MEKAGFFGQLCSFLCPIVGVIIYFCQKDNVTDPENYLYWAAAGFACNLLLMA